MCYISYVCMYEYVLCMWLSCLFLSTSLKPGHPEPCLGSTEGEGGDQTDAPTQQALVPKKEESVLEKEIIDVSYFAMQSIKEWSLTIISIHHKLQFMHAVQLGQKEKVIAMCYWILFTW